MKRSTGICMNCKGNQLFVHICFATVFFLRSNRKVKDSFFTNTSAVLALKCISSRELSFQLLLQWVGNSHPPHTPKVYLTSSHNAQHNHSVLPLQKVANRVTGNHSSCNNQKNSSAECMHESLVLAPLYLPLAASMGTPQNVPVFEEERDAVHCHVENSMSHAEECLLSVS